MKISLIPYTSTKLLLPEKRKKKWINLILSKTLYVEKFELYRSIDSSSYFNGRKIDDGIIEVRRNPSFGFSAFIPKLRINETENSKEIIIRFSLIKSVRYLLVAYFTVMSIFLILDFSSIQWMDVVLPLALPYFIIIILFNYEVILCTEKINEVLVQEG